MLIVVAATSGVPLWAALLTGLGGGVVAAGATISNARAAEFRTRMLTTADEFLQTTIAFLGKTLDVTDMLLRETKAPTAEMDREGVADDGERERAADEHQREPASMVGELRQLYYKATQVEVRLIILFGRNSRTHSTANEITDALSELMDALEALAGTLSGHAYSKHLDTLVIRSAGVDDLVESFAEYARGEVKQTIIGRTRRAVSRVWPRRTSHESAHSADSSAHRPDSDAG